jgi:nitroreductase
MIEPQNPTRFVRSLARILRGRPNIPPSLDGNAMLRTILERRSVRRFTGDPIPDDVFAAILEAGRVAPSTVNLQTWSFACFTAVSWQEAFGSGIPFRGQRAVIVMADTHRARVVLDAFPDSPLVEYTLAVMNASLAAMNMNLAAEALGVSSIMLSETGRSGFLDAAHLAGALGLPDSVIPLMTLVFGYRRGNLPPMPPRLPMDAVAFTGSYRATDPAVMSDWLDQMVAGYKASHPGSSFEAQLKVYLGKIGAAEAYLQQMVLRDANPPPE